MEFNPQFYDHEVVQKTPQEYCEMTISPEKILDRWQSSMFACEILDKVGKIKPQNEMAPETLKKYLDAIEMIKRGEDIPKPVLGIGLMDNIEIGIGREIVAAAANLNLSNIPLHIRNAQAEDIQKALK